MGFFRRITDLITPLPSQHDAVRQDTPPPPEPDADPEATVRLVPELGKLILAEDMNSPEAALAIAELKRIGNVIGLYVAAAKMRFFLDAKRAEGQVIHKDRGYVLAADFIFQHLTRELNGIDTVGHEIGPNVFRSYCNELVACLVSGKNVRRTVEVPMILVDNLLERALSAVEHRDTYLSLIPQVLDSAYAQVLAKYEADQRDRARRRQERKADSGTSSGTNSGTNSHPSAILDPSHSFDGDAVEYMKEMGTRITESVRAFGECTAVQVSHVGAVPPDAAVAQRCLAFLQQVAPIADKAGYQGLVALVAQRTAAALSVAQPDHQAEFWTRAAKAHELQADREARLLLFKLSKRRYKAAQDAYLRAGDAPNAASVGQKMA
ncbi:MAG: hypothetical protein FJY92_04500 [Candidatus Hydrogenedentes bacterium]|nr:hypothetical protein [Candidatus Hydrogenedentota bacterium]